MAKEKAPDISSDPLFTWEFSSSRPRAGGVVAKYLTRLNQDNSLSCNCGGWIMKRPGKPRGCKHTDTVKPQVPAILKAVKEGKELPTIDLEVQRPRLAHGAVEDTSTIKLRGRKMEI